MAAILNPLLVAQKYGTDLSSRSRGVELRSQIELECLAGSIVILDFQGVRTVSESFADEVFGILAVKHGEEWLRTRLSFKNASSTVRRSILEAIACRLARC